MFKIYFRKYNFRKQYLNELGIERSWFLVLTFNTCKNNNGNEDISKNIFKKNLNM